MWTWELLNTEQVLWSFSQESGSVCPAEGFVWRGARFSRIVSCWANDWVSHDIAQGSFIGEATSRRAEALMLFSLGRHIERGMFLSDWVRSWASLLCKMLFTLQVHLLFPILAISINCQLFRKILEVQLAASLVLDSLVFVQVRDLLHMNRIILKVVFSRPRRTLLSWLQSALHAFTLAFVGSPSDAC